MKRFGLAGVALTCVTAFVVTGRATDEPANDKTKTGSALFSTWKLISGSYGGNDFKVPEGQTMLKHVTATQFMWATYDKEGKMFRAAGGPYTLKGDTYEESPEYGFSDDFDLIKGKIHVYKTKIEGNKWYIDGMLASGLTIKEEWERQEKK